MAPRHKDEAHVISVAKQGRQQLETLFAQEREEAARRESRAGWSTDAVSDAPPN